MRGWAHPHVCGEHFNAPALITWHLGSSPRMRGTHYIARRRIFWEGLIPTYAGNTSSKFFCTSASWAHPHVCGEHTPLSVLPCWPDRAHPHVCGEHVPLPSNLFYGAGSSPRMRGTQQEIATEWGGVRLIPTYAGNTSLLSPPFSRVKAHPHVCGEHMIRHCGLQVRSGSSPRMRGTPSSRGESLRHLRLIPTYAGNTARSLPWCWGKRAHPHVCGEHLPVSKQQQCLAGSSPRMRGTHRSELMTAPPMRLIPTYAGNTARPRVCVSPSSAHPHVCGEHSLRWWSMTCTPGSSPRMRGTHPTGRRSPRLGRLIPTYAGNT